MHISVCVCVCVCLFFLPITTTKVMPEATPQHDTAMSPNEGRNSTEETKHTSKAEHQAPQNGSTFTK